MKIKPIKRLPTATCLFGRSKSKLGCHSLWPRSSPVQWRKQLGLYVLFCCLGEMCNVNFASHVDFAGYFDGGCPPIQIPDNVKGDGQYVQDDWSTNQDTGFFSIGAKASSKCTDGTFNGDFGESLVTFTTIEKSTKSRPHGQLSTTPSEHVSRCGRVSAQSVCSRMPKLLWFPHVLLWRDQEAYCDPNEIDILFIIDQSFNVLPERFNYFKDFIRQFLAPVPVSNEAAHVGVILSSDDASYTVSIGSRNRQDWSAFYSKVLVMLLRRVKPRKGIKFGVGSRSRKQHSTFACYFAEWWTGRGWCWGRSKEVASSCWSVSAVGIFRANMNQMNMIAGNNGRALLVNDYADLNDIIAEEVRRSFCPEGTASFFCSPGRPVREGRVPGQQWRLWGTCHNTVGSYVCNCSHGKVLASDGHSCVEDFCRTSNLACSHQCVNDLTGARCVCQDFFTLDEDGQTCIDLNECDQDNGGCSDHCINLSPGYQCACFEAMMLSQDQHTCIEDPCHDDPTRTAVQMEMAPGVAIVMLATGHGLMTQI